MSWKELEPNQNICNYHGIIEDKAREILNIRDDRYEEVKDLLWEVQSLADDILNAVKYAYEGGNRMEGRMRDYRDAIEALGFKRVKE